MAFLSDLRQPPGAVYCWSLRGAAALGLGLSVYLLWLALSAARAAGCGPDSAFDCDSVLTSEWSTWLGLPVSVGGAVMYAAMLLATRWIGPASPPRHQRRAWSVLLVAALAAAGAALWFIYVQKFQLDNRICPWCMAVHLCSIVAAVMVLPRVPIAGSGAAKAPWRALGPKPAVMLCSAAVIALAVLIGGQLIANRPEIDPAQSPANNAAAPPDSAGPTGVTVRPQRIVKLFNGKVKVDAYQLPIQGSPDAKYVMLKIFDYTCSHCRKMHRLLEPLQSRYGDQVAILLAPMPLNSKCNRLVKRTPHAHKHGCEMARLGLAVWRTDRAAFDKFHDWAFETKRARHPKAARAHAEQLIGREKLQAALKDPWIEQQINMDVTIWSVIGKQPIPRLITPMRVMHLHFRDDLYDYLEAGLGLKRIDVEPEPATNAKPQ